MLRISETKLKQIAEAGTILADDDSFVRAIRDSDGRIWKQFRKKSFPSTAALLPYAKRFVKSAELLAKRGINSVAVRDIYTVAETGRHVVVYDEMPGRSLRTVLEIEGAQHLSDFAQFMALLHERGIYFRSMHLDNVLVLDAGGFALIDVTHVEGFRKALNPWRRARNFKPVTSYAEDRAMLDQYGCSRFLEEYLAASHLTDRARQQFLLHLQRLNDHLADAANALRCDETGVAAKSQSTHQPV